VRPPARRRRIGHESGRAAQWLDDAAGTVTRSIANGWLGERLADWTGSGSNLRIYGTNGHRDVTWLASSTGTVSQALRYDPWGNPRAAVPSGYSPFRFQGAWFDATTSLNWVITRWYAPSLGRFISEDALLGTPEAPPSRHLYAYAAGEPIGRWDPDGRYWYVIRAGDTLGSIASRRLQGTGNWPMVYNANKSSTSVVKSTSTIFPGKCLWIPWTWVTSSKAPFASDARCAGKSKPTSYLRVNKLLAGDSGFSGSTFQTAAYKLGAPLPGFVNISPQQLYAMTARWAGRSKRDIQYTETIHSNVFVPNALARDVLNGATRRGTVSRWNNLTEVYGNSAWPGDFAPATAFTMGEYIFYEQRWAPEAPNWLRSHEYIHVLQYEHFGAALLLYLKYSVMDGYRGGPSNPYEAIGYIWQGWTWAYGATSYGQFWRPAP
jgi:RHS repeat-associated protein